MKKWLEVHINVLIDVSSEADLAPDATSGLIQAVQDWIQKNNIHISSHPYKSPVTAMVHDWEGGGPHSV